MTADDLPPGMTASALDIAQRLLPAAVHLKPTDATLFAQMCEAYAVADRMRNGLEKPLISAHGKVSTSPAWNAWREATADAMRVAAALSLTPASRDCDPIALMPRTPARPLYKNSHWTGTDD